MVEVAALQVFSPFEKENHVLGAEAKSGKMIMKQYRSGQIERTCGKAASAPPLELSHNCD